MNSKFESRPRESTELDANQERSMGNGRSSKIATAVTARIPGSSPEGSAAGRVRHRTHGEAGSTALLRFGRESPLSESGPRHRSSRIGPIAVIRWTLLAEAERHLSGGPVISQSVYRAAISQGSATYLARTDLLVSESRNRNRDTVGGWRSWRQFNCWLNGSRLTIYSHRAAPPGRRRRHRRRLDLGVKLCNAFAMGSY